MDKQYLVEKIGLALVKIDQGYLNYVKGLLRDVLIELSKPDEGEMAVNYETAMRLDRDAWKAQAKALAQALNKIDELEQGTCYSTMQGELSDHLALRSSMRRAGEIAREASALYRSGKPPRKSVPLAMLEEFCQIEETVPIERIVIFFKQRGYEVTE